MEIFGVDLRIVFLFSMAITAFLVIIIPHETHGFFGNLIQIFLSFLLVVFGSTTAIVFFLLLTRTNPVPYLRQAGYMVGVQQLVNFDTAIPPRLEKNLAVSDIVKLDTDGDNFKEWVVFYNFDLRGDTGPVYGYVYDNDRGNPPVIFPYALLPPNRSFLSQGTVNSIELDNVVVAKNGPNGDLPEIVVQGNNELSIFTFLQNSAEWDYPRDAPPRYQPVGFFAGSGGVYFDPDNKTVTVNERQGLERSQLVNRQVYAVNKATNTYWDKYYDPAELDRQLAAPIVSTVDFQWSPPSDIVNTTYPENIVLAFYAATCGRSDGTLCRHAGAGWDAEDFLDPNGDAYGEYNNNNAAFFELPSLNDNQNISVKALQYYPQIETDPDLLTLGGGRDVVTGEQAQANVVDIVFALDDGGQSERVARYRMSLVGGQWKIYGRLSDPDLPELGAPSTLGQ